MDQIRWDMILPVLFAALAGAAVGYEREYRGRSAGFRTHILFALSSALLMVGAVNQLEWIGPEAAAYVEFDPVRMAQGVLTGEGVLCAGVTFRGNFSVHGLTTAASLWTVSAVGILFGAGLYDLAIAGTLATTFVLAALRWADEHMPQLKTIDLAVRYRREEAPGESRFRAGMAALDLKTRSLEHRLIRDGELLEYVATLQCSGRPDTEALADRLRADAAVREFELSPR